jgi:hypothetical protein
MPKKQNSSLKNGGSLAHNADVAVQQSVAGRAKQCALSPQAPRSSTCDALASIVEVHRRRNRVSSLCATLYTVGGVGELYQRRSSLL